MTPSLPSVDANVGVLLSKSQYIYSVGLTNRMMWSLQLLFSRVQCRVLSQVPFRVPCRVFSQPHFLIHNYKDQLVVFPNKQVKKINTAQNKNQNTP